MHTVEGERTLRWAACILGASIFVGFAWAQPQAATQVPCQTAAVRTVEGAVCGLEVPAAVAAQPAPEHGSAPLDVQAFLGIPYAQSTAGAHRFLPPIGMEPWDGVRQATVYGNACPQQPYDKLGAPQSEDCLFLNVWSPVSKSDDFERDVPKAVLVFIPGGAFVMGSSSEQLYENGPSVYDGARLASTQGIVVVTLNYRLGALGFLSAAPGIEANLGLRDQVAALTWVRDNIAAFGGDPKRVTLAGESAGAVSVRLHMTAMPGSSDLFRAAILESDPMGVPSRTMAQARSLAEIYLSGVGCKWTFDTRACLQRVPLDRLLEVQRSAWLRLPLLTYGLPAFLSWAPVVDGTLVTRQSLRAAFDGATDKPLLIGTNADEGTIFFAAADPIGFNAFVALNRVMFGPDSIGPINARYPGSRNADNVDQVIRVTTDYLFTCPSRALARSASDKAFLYHFETVPSSNIQSAIPRCADESCHAAELPFVFGTATGALPFTGPERSLSDAMMSYWGAFVRTGSAPDVPASVGPTWPALSSPARQIVFDDGVTVSEVPSSDAAHGAAVCSFWDDFGYDMGDGTRLRPSTRSP